MNVSTLKPNVLNVKKHTWKPNKNYLIRSTLLQVNNFPTYVVYFVTLWYSTYKLLDNCCQNPSKRWNRDSEKFALQNFSLRLNSCGLKSQGTNILWAKWGPIPESDKKNAQNFGWGQEPPNLFWPSWGTNSQTETSHLSTTPESPTYFPLFPKRPSIKLEFLYWGLVQPQAKARSWNFLSF